MDVTVMISNPELFAPLSPVPWDRRNPGSRELAPDQRSWLRRRLILNISLFALSFIGVGLVLIFLDV